MSAPHLVLTPGAVLSTDGIRLGGALTRVHQPLLAFALVDGARPADLGADVPGSPAAAELDRLHRRGLITWRIPGVADAAPFLPGVGLPRLTDDPTAATGPPGHGPVALSRFALLRRDPAGWVLESGRSPWQVRLTDRGVGALGDDAVAEEQAGALRLLLRLAGMLDDTDGEDVATHWTHGDRIFAARSRTDVRVPPVAPRQALRAGPPEPAARSPFPDADVIELPVPAGPQPDEPTLWAATERRRTIRDYADEPVPLASLGALLWRTLRIRRIVPRDPADPASYESAFRPVPSGGAMHGIDLWLVCLSVAGVPRGVWRYDPVAHALTRPRARHPGADADLDRLLQRIAGVGTGQPGIFGLLTVRHARAGWKYGDIAYALELKDVGVVMHALQLTAGAVGLGMCHLGSGPTQLVARVLGVDPEVDAPIGEFLLGVPHGPTPAG